MGLAGDVYAFLTDPANWSGDEGIPTLFFEHLQISFWSMVVAAAIALPIGVLVGHARKGGVVAVNLANIGRAIPSFGLLLLMVIWIGNKPQPFPLSIPGNLPVSLVLIALAIPPMLTNAYVAIAEIDPEVREAGRGMGLNGRQMLTQVELPMGVPLIMAGVRISAVAVVATATIAAFVGFGGFGRYIIDGFKQADGDAKLWAGALLVGVFALAVEGLLALVQRWLTPKGLRVGSHGPLVAMAEGDEPAAASGTGPDAESRAAGDTVL